MTRPSSVSAAVDSRSTVTVRSRRAAGAMLSTARGPRPRLRSPSRTTRRWRVSVRTRRGRCWVALGTGPGLLEPPGGRREPIAALPIVAEHVLAGARRRQEHGSAGASHLGPEVHRLLDRGHRPNRNPALEHRTELAGG